MSDTTPLLGRRSRDGRRRSTDRPFLIRRRRRRRRRPMIVPGVRHVARIFGADRGGIGGAMFPTILASDRLRAASRGASGPTMNDISWSGERRPILTAPRDSDSVRSYLGPSSVRLARFDGAESARCCCCDVYSWSSTSTGRRASFRARNRGQRGFREKSASSWAASDDFERYPRDRSILACPHASLRVSINFVLRTGIYVPNLYAGSRAISKLGN